MNVWGDEALQMRVERRLLHFTQLGSDLEVCPNGERQGWGCEGGRYCRAFTQVAAAYRPEPSSAGIYI